MKFQGALIKEQGVTFAVVIVKKSVVDDRATAQNVIQSFQPAFPGTPIVLMSQDSRGIPTYFGRQDIAKFLAKIPMTAIPWREYSIN
jgi:hypothetical protein